MKVRLPGLDAVENFEGEGIEDCKSLLGCSLLCERLAAALAFMVSECFLFLARLSASPVLMGRSEREAAFCQRPMCQTQNLKQHWRT
jgi:hypothetical protein